MTERHSIDKLKPGYERQVLRERKGTGWRWGIGDHGDAQTDWGLRSEERAVQTMNCGERSVVAPWTREALNSTRPHRGRGTEDAWQLGTHR